MGKVAFLFPGQGAQFPGMGEALKAASPAAAEIFAAADALWPGLSDMCFSGTEEDLRQTRNTQPCIFAVELATAAALTERGVHADVTAGFSLGEIAALTYAGAVDFDAGFRLVSRRGELMQQASEANPSSMVAVLKLPNETVEALCAEFSAVYPTNYNCPGQVSVSGRADEMDVFVKRVKEAKGRAIPIKTAGGFHSPFMASAAEQFAADLAQCEFQAPRIPLYSNCTGLPYDGEMTDLLQRQIISPVRWEAIIRHMIDSGVDTFIEAGPGNTLCGFIQRISDTVRAFHVGDEDELNAVVKEVTSC
ncbi:MAG: ACP S-malonyltransferase [Oscillospiraceae bacterium]|nr:ACP S-malonyltransferase [Oscillospiraceae bacterium]